MSPKIISIGIVRAVMALLIMSAFFYFFYQIQVVLIYLIVALILTLIGNPIVDFFKGKLKFPHTLATITTLLFFISILFGVFLLFIPLILKQGENLSLLKTIEIEKNTAELINKINFFLESHHINAQKSFNFNSILAKINFGALPDFLNSLVGTIGSLGMGLASVLFITFFFLKDRVLFIREAKKLIPDSHEVQILNSLFKINHLLSRYFIGLLIQLFVVFILYIIVLLIFGIPNPIIIAFLCAVLNIIPYIGPLIASVLAALLTMMSNLGNDFQTEILPTTIFVLIGFWVVQLIDNNLSQPIIFSRSVSSHPLEIFLIILIAGFLFGILGMVIAVPAFTIIKVIGKEFFPENTLIQLLTKNI